MCTTILQFVVRNAPVVECYCWTTWCGLLHWRLTKIIKSFPQCRIRDIIRRYWEKEAGIVSCYRRGDSDGCEEKFWMLCLSNWRQQAPEKNAGCGRAISQYGVLFWSPSNAAEAWEVLQSDCVLWFYRLHICHTRLLGVFLSASPIAASPAGALFTFINWLAAIASWIEVWYRPAVGDGSIASISYYALNAFAYVNYSISSLLSR